VGVDYSLAADDQTLTLGERFDLIWLFAMGVVGEAAGVSYPGGMFQNQFGRIHGNEGAVDSHGDSTDAVGLADYPGARAGVERVRVKSQDVCVSVGGSFGSSCFGGSCFRH